MFENKYPYSDFHELNLDWVISRIMEVEKEINEFTALNKIVWSGEWNIGKTYTSWSIVEVDGDGYLATRPVPTGVDINNTDYWTPIYKYSALYSSFEDRIAELEEAVTELKAKSNAITYYFPCSPYNSGTSGTCVICKTEAGAIVMDFGAEPNAITIRNCLKSHNISKIAAIIISHYHDDHVGSAGGLGISAFLTDDYFDFTECKAYLPHNLMDWNSFIDPNQEAKPLITANEIAVKNILNNYVDVVYPEEGDAVIIGNAEVVFNNLTTAKFNEYYSYTLNGSNTDVGFTTYNNFTMLVTVNHLGHKFVYTGDVHSPAEALNAFVVAGADIYTAPHHGGNYVHADNWIDNLNPEVLIIPAYTTIYNDSVYLKPDIVKCLTMRATAFYTYRAEETTVIDDGVGISASCIGSQYTYTRLSQEMSYGEMIKNVDLNTFAELGVFVAANSQDAASCANAPWTTAGFKLIVTQTTASRQLVQIAMRTGSPCPEVALRQRGSGDAGAWGPWTLLTPSILVYNQPITNADFLKDVTVNATNDRTFYSIVNGILQISLQFKVNEAIDSGTNFFSKLIEYDGQSIALSMLAGSDGNVYPIRTGTAGSNTTLQALKDIPADITLYGSIMLDLNTRSFS